MIINSLAGDDDFELRAVLDGRDDGDVRLHVEVVLAPARERPLDGPHFAVPYYLLSFPLLYHLGLQLDTPIPSDHKLGYVKM